MFNLESSIADWRQQMLAVGIKTPAPLDELESHLREEIQELIASGMEPSAAFASARAKIGQPAPLQTEFTKITETTSKWDRYIASASLYVVYAIWFGLVVPVAIHALWKLDLNFGWRLVGLANVAVVSAAILGYQFLNTLFPVILDRRRRLAIGISANLCGYVLFFMVPHFSFYVGLITVLLMCGLTLIFMGAVLFTGLANIAVGGAAVLGYQSLNTLFPLVLDRRRRLAIVISASLCGYAGMFILLFFMVPHLSFAMGHLTVLVMCGLNLTLIGAVLLTSLEEAEKRNIITTA